MHDPCTVAHEIKYPWWEHRPWPRDRRGNPREQWEDVPKDQRAGCDPMWRKGYRDTLVTIWHVDPERDGSDDSCRWSVPRVPQPMVDRLKSLAWNESKYPYFLHPGKAWTGTKGEAEVLFRALLIQIALFARVKLTYEQAAKIACEAVHQPDCCPVSDLFAFQPGHHTNFPTDDEKRREEYFHGKCVNLLAWYILRPRRAWYKHPRWHVWHWRLQIHPLQNFMHRHISRCDVCGKRMKDSVRIGTCWDRPHVAWWKRIFIKRPWYVRHEDCANPNANFACKDTMATTNTQP